MGFFRWLWEDTKNDFKKIGGMMKKPEEYNIDPRRIMTPKFFALFVILFFFCGMFIGAKYYQVRANAVIEEKCQGYFGITCPADCIKRCNSVALGGMEHNPGSLVEIGFMPVDFEDNNDNLS